MAYEIRGEFVKGRKTRRGEPTGLRPEPVVTVVGRDEALDFFRPAGPA